MTSPSLQFVLAAASSLYWEFQLEKVLVTVRHPKTGEIAQYAQDRRTPGFAPSPGYAIVSEAVRLSGRQVGQIELHSSSGPLKATQLMQVAQSLRDEITDTLAA